MLGDEGPRVEEVLGETDGKWVETGEVEEGGGKLAEVLVDQDAGEEAAEVGLLDSTVLSADAGAVLNTKVWKVSVGAVTGADEGLWPRVVDPLGMRVDWEVGDTMVPGMEPGLGVKEVGVRTETAVGELWEDTVP